MNYEVFEELLVHSFVMYFFVIYIYTRMSYTKDLIRLFPTSRAWDNKIRPIWTFRQMKNDK